MADHMPDDLSAAGKDLRALPTSCVRHGVVRDVHGEWVLLRHALVGWVGRPPLKIGSWPGLRRTMRRRARATGPGRGGWRNPSKT